MSMGAAAGVIILVVLSLGSLHALTPATVLLVQAVTWSLVLRASRPYQTDVDWTGLVDGLLLRPERRVVGAAIYIGTTVLVYIALIGLYQPFYEYDVLKNHLFAPARWVQRGMIYLVPTHFGASTSEYEPMNTELIYAWLMLPFHSDLFARSARPRVSPSTTWRCTPSAGGFD